MSLHVRNSDIVEKKVYIQPFGGRRQGRPGPDNGLKRRRMRRFIDFGITQEIREMIWSVAHVGN